MGGDQISRCPGRVPVRVSMRDDRFGSVFLLLTGLLFWTAHILGLLCPRFLCDPRTLATCLPHADVHVKSCLPSGTSNGRSFVDILGAPRKVRVRGGREGARGLAVLCCRHSLSVMEYDPIFRRDKQMKKTASSAPAQVVDTVIFFFVCTSA